ncbi:hypothetical protein A2631_00785 [Candidatus Daviesbacteria bacterium RIFCSPHIGHO2_01_FULL_44_29]|uniref:Gamma-glutamylcyclotransferase AIG2-like domain-containing protein n=1 Tax=Candidatus Daviesbacteria bacterium RIFCSPHIGHO2_02_FULL_43_12 TaxID=1797776 RepID=A0A1F5KH32_9BACT|nr:MAG: hypothetical protein A2631_00785 [Candidatus Daviesbacteria bacterium RIFCSPHIGHO2_01_FULL_44_29]OGE39377.1 MAG: hypothetical protein A3E86_01645 [Candidatus Daviesbacteria bacterium RIFCSPHIGHO2_12_FULL_47_45]OGE40256.1 MAG: hypothetical protein A3D25_05250 [Candidatus Daviesbacteria bacterium RIFCSPHIGHO2_02_FULL_43_12]OGE69055.1 MAG: hypothetical protein A3B55_02330 [Candidatus Daviesbacteria bacterium RIFCSPLOWO2_01_FULL_43_15]
MDDSTKTIVKYFGYGSNADRDMMVHMVGREDLKGEPGKLIGYQLCIQTLDQIRDIVPEASPVKTSPREMIRQTYGDSFELFIAIPKPDAVAYGTIWDLTPEEVNLVKEWELVDYGMQEEVNAMAMDSAGNLIQVETQAVLDPPGEFDRVVEGNDYPRYIADRDAMLREADKARLSYQKMLSEQNTSQN